MTLIEIFKKLSYSHLSELSIGGEGSGLIPDKHQPKIIQRINEGLIALYARFPLRIKTLDLQTYAAINEYHLHSDYATGSTADPLPEYLYILTEGFADDILMIESIVDEDDEVVPLNDANDEDSWHVVGNHILSVNEPEDDLVYRIRYRAAPDEIEFGPPVPKTEVIPIPRILEAALIAYVAGQIYGNMSMEGALAKSQHFLDMYENECKIVEERDLLNSSPMFTNQKPKLNGWP